MPSSSSVGPVGGQKSRVPKIKCDLTQNAVTLVAVGQDAEVGGHSLRRNVEKNILPLTIVFRAVYNCVGDPIKIARSIGKSIRDRALRQNEGRIKLQGLCRWPHVGCCTER